MAVKPAVALSNYSWLVDGPISDDPQIEVSLWKFYYYLPLSG